MEEETRRDEREGGEEEKRDEVEVVLVQFSESAVSDLYPRSVWFREDAREGVDEVVGKCRSSVKVGRSDEQAVDAGFPFADSNLSLSLFITSSHSQ